MTTAVQMSFEEQMDFLANGGMFHQSGATISESLVNPGIYVMVFQEGDRRRSDSAHTLLEMWRLATQGSYPMEEWIPGDQGEAWDKAVEVTFSRPEVTEHLNKGKDNPNPTPSGVI